MCPGTGPQALQRQTPVQQAWYPRYSQRDCLRKTGSARHHQTMQSFAEDKNRDAKARLFDHILLDAIDTLSPMANRPAPPETSRAEGTYPAVDESSVLISDKITIVIKSAAIPRDERDELPPFLFQCHLPKKIFDSFFNRQRRVLVLWCLIPCKCGEADQRKAVTNDNVCVGMSTLWSMSGITEAAEIGVERYSLVLKDLSQKNACSSLSRRDEGRASHCEKPLITG